jgi:hypothetical protein
VPVAHLTRQARPAASAHEAVPPQVGHLQGRHLSCDLPELRDEEDDGPDELKRGPGGYGDEEWVLGGDEAEVSREETGRRNGGRVSGEWNCCEVWGSMSEWPAHAEGGVARTRKREIIEEHDSQHQRDNKDNELPMIVQSHCFCVSAKKVDLRRRTTYRNSRPMDNGCIARSVTGLQSTRKKEHTGHSLRYTDHILDSVWSEVVFSPSTTRQMEEVSSLESTHHALYTECLAIQSPFTSEFFDDL